MYVLFEVMGVRYLIKKLDKKFLATFRPRIKKSI